MPITKEDLVHYYDSCEKDYHRFWDLDRSLAMHAGYWDETTRSLPEALARENEILAQLAKIKPGDRVLDAGCGVGGSSIYLANKYRCQVTGITLSDNQVRKAQSYAHNRGVSNPPEFFVMDFSHTTFPAETFDVVWGLESICHANDKRLFLQEAFRILKPQGRLVIADGFMTHDRDQLLDKWLKGWRVNSLETVHTFGAHLRACGFSRVSFNDITPNVLPSSRRLFFISIPALFFSRLGEFLGWRTRVQTNNIRSAFYQYRAIKKGLWKYGIFYAEKG
ncbi:MAG: SAM-dependent methyltransferase [Waddliaceae bacterium]